MKNEMLQLTPPTILQSYSHQNSMAPAQKQKYISIEQEGKPRDKSKHIWSPYL